MHRPTTDEITQKLLNPEIASIRIPFRYRREAEAYQRQIHAESPLPNLASRILILPEEKYEIALELWLM